jgi:hypothetical protein
MDGYINFNVCGFLIFLSSGDPLTSNNI